VGGAKDTSRPRPPPVKLILVAALGGAWAALAALLGYVATLPRAATPLGQEHELYGSLVAHSEDAAYLVTNARDALVVVSLPAFEVRARLPLTGSPTSVAWDGSRLLLSLDRTGWALASADRWLVPPRHRADESALHSVFRDVRTGSLVLASLKTVEASQHQAWQQEVSLSTVGPAGELAQPLIIRRKFGGTYYFCGSLGELYATSMRPGGVCRFGQADQQGVADCEPVKGDQLQCANVVSLGVPGEVIGAGGRVAFRRPPAKLTDGDWPSRYFFRLLSSGGELPQAQWFSSEGSFVAPAGEAFIAIGHDAATREHNRVGLNQPSHQQLELWDPGGEQARATNKLFGQSFLPDFMLQSGEQMVAYFHTNGAIARFRISDLARTDAGDTIWAVRERLRPWGGASRLFELSLASALCLGPAVLGALFTRWGRSRWGRRAAIGYLALAAVILYATARRIWWF
jgi:hypothetical protein